MTRARRLGKCVASVLLLAAANESVETRGGRITRSNAVLRLEQLGQLGGLEDAILQVVSLSTQVGGESIAVARLEGAQGVDIAWRRVWESALTLSALLLASEVIFSALTRALDSMRSARVWASMVSS